MSGYAELGAISSFSFLQSTMEPEELVEVAHRLGLSSLALTDYGGVYGIPRFHRAARSLGINPITGATLDIHGLGRIRLLCESLDGYQNLCRLSSLGHRDQPKGRCVISLEQLAQYRDGLICLAGPMLTHASAASLSKLQSVTAKSNLFVEVNNHLTRESISQKRTLLDSARALGLSALATNFPHYARAQHKPLLDILTCIRMGAPLDSAGRNLFPNAERRLKSPQNMHSLFPGESALLRQTERIAERCHFTLDDLAYQFPSFPTASGQSQGSLLRELTLRGARERYGALTPSIKAQLQKELQVISKLELAGYFLIVWDIVRFARDHDIMVQGRGSAANSAVCYALGITAVDPIGMQLLFERFLSEERGEWPDIDLDLPSGPKRERVIQYVYRAYGPAGAAMTANVITYRTKSALREVGKALGFSSEKLDRVSRSSGRWSSLEDPNGLQEVFSEAGLDPKDERVALWVQHAAALRGRPRHLGQHSGGMVIAAGRLDEVVPIEPASMPGRSVIQWDKEDCSELGIIKVDLLGLGMLNALERAIPLVRATEGIELDYAKLPPRDPQVYDLISRADTIGVFQIESRAQMSTLPRLKPQCFYDLVIEIALIRPGPIVGQMVHPYMRRRDGIEPVTYAHPSLEPILARTLGVPIFQEQILRMAMAVAGFTGGEAEELRRAMGFKRSEERMQSIQARLREGMVQNAIPPETRENIITQITSFALYGFPESHSASFALIAYASAYLKTHHPGAFLCSLLNAWPMGFYSPATLIKDAQRRGVSVQAIDVTKSDYACTLPDARTVRMGLRYVSGLREQSAASIVQARQRAPFESLSDLRQRVSMSQKEWMSLAELGAFQKLGPTRRQAIWQLSRHPTPALFASLPSKHHTSPLQEMSFEQRIASDYKNSSFSVGPHPIHLIRSALDRAHVASSHSLNQRPHGSKVRVAGVVIIRQRPMTAKGLLFITLEDEFGLINLIISPNLFEKQRTLAVSAAALLAEGTVQSHRGVIHLKCEQIFDLYRHIPRPTQAHTHPEKTHLLQRKIQ